MKRKIRPGQLLFALLVVDLFFISLHIALRLVTDPYDDTLSNFQGSAYLRSIFLNENLFVNTDRGYPEIYQYLKELIIVVVLFYFAYSRRMMHFLFLGLLFLMILLDDALMLHERLGWLFVDWLNIKAYGDIERQDVAQILSMSIIEGWVVVLIGVSYFWVPANMTRTVMKLFGLIFLLMVFGVLVDLMHSLIREQMRGVDLIEDGGEMLIMSFIVYYVYKHYFLDAVLPTNT